MKHHIVLLLFAALTVPAVAASAPARPTGVSYGLLTVINHTTFPAKVYATDNGAQTFLGRLGPGDEIGKAEPIGDTISLEADLITPDPVIIVQGPTYVQDYLEKWPINYP